MPTCPECARTFDDGVEVCPDDGAELLSDDLLTPHLTLEPGTMLGEYRVGDRLGSGTFGDVYAGEQPLIGKRVAIKVLNRRFNADPQVVSRFVAEARAVNRIRHRNIIDIFSFSTHASQPYFVMELLDGETLGELLARRGPLPFPEAWPIIEGVADALDAAHAADVTHRDLKPDNIFVARDNKGRRYPKLLDFGIAKLADTEKAHKTATGFAIGTPRYMSPEQARGRKVDHRADIYALGVVIHEILVGEPPFDGETAMDVLFAHTAEAPPSMSSMNDTLPESLDAPVLAMLEKRPPKRPGSAGDAAKALLEAAVAAGLIQPPTSSELKTAPRIPPVPSSGPVVSDALSSYGEPSSKLESSEFAAPSGAGARDGSEGVTAEPSTRLDAGPRPRGDDPTVMSDDAVPSAARSDGRAPSTAAATTRRDEGDEDVETDRDEEVAATVPQRPSLVGSEPETTERSAGVSSTLPSSSAAGGEAGVTVRSPLARIPDEEGKPAVSTAGSSPSGTPPWAMAAVALGALAVAGVAVYKSGAAPAPAPSASSPAPPVTSSAVATVTVELDVEPADARVLVDGREMGTAGSPLVLPHGEVAREVRFEKQGFAMQVITVVPNRDQTTPAIVLTPKPTPASAKPTTASTGMPVAPVPRVNTQPKGDHKDIQRPPGL